MFFFPTRTQTKLLLREDRLADACYACGTTLPSVPLYSVASCEISRCSRCGLGSAGVPKGFDPKTIYNETYFQGGQADGYADYQGSRDTLSQEFQRIVVELARHGATSGNLLEYGCAYGYFLDEAKARFTVTGVELAQDAIASCRARGLEVFREATEDTLRARGPFHSVVLLDVIEHLENPQEVLKQAFHHMPPGGILALTTGDFGSLFARVTGRRWRLMTPPQHLWFFTVPSISALLHRCGFEVVAVAHPGKRVPASLVGYQAARYLGLQRHFDATRLRFSIPVNLFDAMRVYAVRT